MLGLKDFCMSHRVLQISIKQLRQLENQLVALITNLREPLRIFAKRLLRLNESFISMRQLMKGTIPSHQRTRRKEYKWLSLLLRMPRNFKSTLKSCLNLERQVKSESTIPK